MKVIDSPRLLTFVLLSIFALATSAHDIDHPATADEALSLLEEMLDSRLAFQQARQADIDSLKSRFDGCALPVDRYRLLDNIAHRYEGFQLDSAITYRYRAARLAQEAGLVSDAAVQQARRCSRLSEVGETSRAITAFESINPDLIDPADKIEYYGAGARLFMSFADYYPIDTVRQEFREMAVTQLDSVLTLTRDDEPVHGYALAHKYLKEGQMALSIGHLTSILDRVGPSDQLYCDAARTLGNIYRSQGKSEQAIYYLCLSAISDCHAGSRDSRALMALAELLYADGDVSRAYSCLRVALDNSVKSGANLHSMEAARQVPLISGAFREQDKRKVSLLIALSVILFILLVAIVGILFYVRREMKMMARMKQNVIEANRMKETYISHFLNLCSIYLEKLEEFSRMAGRKITAGQVDELYEMIRSGKMMDEQSRIFYEKFDNAFIHIFPGFVDGVNALLQPDKRITPPADGRLTTELRILAFARLGIDDAGQIARFLGLSLNTIYTYRNKLRGKAVDRANFEANVMAIGQIK